MDLTLTYNELLNFPDEFLKESSKYYEVSYLSHPISIFLNGNE